MKVQSDILFEKSQLCAIKTTTGTIKIFQAGIFITIASKLVAMLLIYLIFGDIVLCAFVKNYMYSFLI